MHDIEHINFDNKKNNRTDTMYRYSSNDTNKLAYIISAAAEKIYMTLKPGLPKCVYQLMLYNDLLKKGLLLQTETSMLNPCTKHEPEKELIIVNGMLVIECFVNNEMTDYYQKRAIFNLKNNNYEKSMLINFSDEKEDDLITMMDHVSVLH
jgi:GxxExxY protein